MIMKKRLQIVVAVSLIHWQTAVFGADKVSPWWDLRPQFERLSRNDQAQIDALRYPLVRAINKTAEAGARRAFSYLRYNVRVVGLKGYHSQPGRGEGWIHTNHPATIDPILRSLYLPRDIRPVANENQVNSGGVQGYMMRYKRAISVADTTAVDEKIAKEIIQAEQTVNAVLAGGGKIGVHHTGEIDREGVAAIEGKHFAPDMILNSPEGTRFFLDHMHGMKGISFSTDVDGQFHGFGEIAKKRAIDTTLNGFRPAGKRDVVISVEEIPQAWIKYWKENKDTNGIIAYLRAFEDKFAPEGNRAVPYRRQRSGFR